MKREYRYNSSLRFFRLLLAIAFFCLFAYALPAAPQAAPKTPAKPAAKTFDSPQQAAEALIAAAEKFDVPALEEIFGPEGHDIILTGEEALDREKTAEFAALAREKNSVSCGSETCKSRHPDRRQRGLAVSGADRQKRGKVVV